MSSRLDDTAGVHKASLAAVVDAIDACAAASDVLISYIEEKKAAAEASAKKKGSAEVAVA